MDRARAYHWTQKRYGAGGTCSELGRVRRVGMLIGAGDLERFVVMGSGPTWDDAIKDAERIEPMCPHCGFVDTDPGDRDDCVHCGLSLTVPA